MLTIRIGLGLAVVAVVVLLATGNYLQALILVTTDALAIYFAPRHHLRQLLGRA